MFRTILVPTDGSEHFTKTLPLIRTLASRMGASVTLLCVESPVVNMGNMIDNSGALVDHVDRLRVLERAVEELQREGIAAQYDIAFGRPEAQIENGAKKHQADLIVMTPHQRTGFDALLHPSVTSRMFSSVSAPLLIVPERAAATARAGILAEAEATVVAPLDGSELAERALAFAVAIAQEYGRRLQLVRVVPAPHTASAYDEAYERPDSHAQHLMHEARHYMSSLQTGLARVTTAPMDVQVTIGEAAPEIVDIAAESPTNLIVMSTHGHGTLGRILLGSVATEVARSATVPVLVVPPHARLPESDAGLISAVTVDRR